ncbi:cytoplasmic methionine-tRNA ligase Mrs1 [Schizosaccharomyces japonicus yFS275]|uniref:methionine--tRNA ligase n=1 Tax=Schizosaccharomyces japonicus (strain yFS275 / FY16936) TaxID=402676 RepID=B6JZX1_SCHJY|nr:cytoplasmic methionine-tRNA ligase Mrs1 [Schizosaccharomyces japonicus yFS275]EEB06121.1 cytoplasmic methionine-tRNA ligase Mrs1 [Schizosaccharomyces japonicus yFS275]
MATFKLQIPAVSKESFGFHEALKAAIAVSAFAPKTKVEGAAPCNSVRLTDAKDASKYISDANAIVSYLYWKNTNLTAEKFLSVEHKLLDWDSLNLSPLLIAADAPEKRQIVLTLLDNAIQNFKLDASVTPANVIIFADVYSLINGPEELEPFETLKSFYSKFAAHPFFQKSLNLAIEKTKGQTAEISSEQIPISEETRKLRPKIELMQERKKSGVLPKPNSRNILITSALPYVNNVPHLGNIIGSTLSADVFARYHRARNNTTLYICGTDEYGTATETKALEEGVSPKELCDKYHKLHKEVYDWFQLDFDFFGRTTTPKQTEISQHIFNRLYERDYMEVDSMTQLYCEEHKGFLADRYVEGTCPKCGFDDARGDQCDGCGQLLNAFELINPTCKLDKTTPVKRETRHIFLSLDKLQPQIQEWFQKSSKEGHWSNNGVAITDSWLKEGLRPRCITRDLKWGTPVPLEEFKDKVLYVWFDATIGYISITANYTDEWKQWWKNPENVKLYQFMGKDNVPFHTVIFPGSLLGTDEKWTMLHHINTTDYLNYESGKFSKSRGIGVFGNNAKELGLSPSVWRYYLLASRPETSDTMFTWKEFITRHNSELLANIGNLVNRVVKFTTAKYNGLVPYYLEDASVGSGKLKTELVKDVNAILRKYNTALEAVKLREGLRIAMELSARGNQFLQDNRVDNKLFTNERQKCADAIGYTLNLVYLLASILSPFIPATSDSIYKQLNAPALAIPDEWTLDLLPGHRIGNAEYLFTRIDESMEEVWRGKYGGSQK